MALQIGRRATLIPATDKRVFVVVMALSHAEVDRLYATPSVAAYRPEAGSRPTRGRIEHCRPVLQSSALDEPITANPEYAAKLRVVAARLGLPAEYLSEIN
jgi:hypothetical protein